MDLTAQVNKILNDYVDEVNGKVLKAEEDVAKDAISKLKSTSPKSSHARKKHYADSWYVDKKTKKYYGRIVVANKQYRLTHLLEKGHDVVRNGRKVGRAKAQPHIKPVEEWIKEEVVRRIEEEI